MHRPTITAATIEIIATYGAEKANTRRDNWAVHRITVVASPDESLRGGMEIEASGESKEWEFGSDEEPELRIGCDYKFLGTVDVNEWRGKKTKVFKFRTFYRCQPHSKQAILRYLGECPNVGPKIAASLYDRFASDAVKVLRESPATVAAAIPLLAPRVDKHDPTSPTKAELAAAHLKKMAALEHTTIELMDLLAGYGLPKATAKRAIQRWGNRAAETIKRNPLGTLMGFRGCGFLKADKVYQAQGLPLDALKRMTLCAWHHLSSDANGHTWFSREKVLSHIRLNVGGQSSLPRKQRKFPKVKDESPQDRAIRAGVRSGLLAEYVDDAGTRWLAEGEKAREERALADVVLAAMEEPNPWLSVLGSPEFETAAAPLEPYQRDALVKVLNGGTIGILGGGPGSGKTFTAATLMQSLVQIFGAGQIAATAFTGKAARRFTESMAAYKIPVTAVTTHSLLKVKNFSEEAEDDGEQSEFEFNEKNPLNCRLIVVDEVSMNSVPLLLAILKARPRGCGVLLIGDVNQLPPIEHGAPLRDAIAAGLPYGELTGIRRNAGQVVRLCKKLRENHRIQIVDFDRLERLSPDALDPINCGLISTPSPQAILNETIRALKFVQERWGYDPVWDCQVIVARNDKGDLSRKKLNDLLQREFNPTAAVAPGCRFRVGDKCIQQKNTMYETLYAETLAPDGGKAPVANGEFCQVLEIRDKHIVAKFFAPDRVVLVPRVKEFPNTAAPKLAGEGESSDSPATGKLAFDLGLAVTCHKMQGSQAKCVIVVLDKGAYGLSCEWLLTAVSRIEKVCVCVGEFGVASRMAGNRSLGERKTFLKELIEGGRLFSERVWWTDSNMETVTV